MASAACIVFRKNALFERIFVLFDRYFVCIFCGERCVGAHLLNNFLKLKSADLPTNIT